MKKPTFKQVQVEVLKPASPSPHRPAAGPSSPGTQKFDHHGRPLPSVAPAAPTPVPAVQKSTPNRP